MFLPHILPKRIKVLPNTSARFKEIINNIISFFNFFFKEKQMFKEVIIRLGGSEKQGRRSQERNV